LADAGKDMPQSAQRYVADRLRQGWFVRRLSEGATEETHELSLDAASALRFMAGLASPCVAVIESRLATLITQLTRLADETDADATRRVAADRHRRTLVLDVRQQVEFMAREIDDGDRRRGRGMSNWRWQVRRAAPETRVDLPCRGAGLPAERRRSGGAELCHGRAGRRLR
jgi:hypothetical protein